MNTRKIVNFFFEMGVMKRETIRGPVLAGVKETRTIADHSLRAAFIGYILASLEKANPERIFMMLAIHDIAECRIGDQHKVAARYYNQHPIEKRAFNDQCKNLPKEVQKKWQQYFLEFNSRKTKDSIVAKDADWLESALTAKEYLERGYKGFANWIRNVSKALETKSAKKLLREIKRQKSYDWWKGLKKMTYKKLYK